MARKETGCKHCNECLKVNTLVLDMHALMVSEQTLTWCHCLWSSNSLIVATSTPVDPRHLDVLLLVIAGGVVLRDNKTQELRRMPLSGLFFAIGHAPATAFLGGQLELDEYGYIVTAPDSTATSIPGETTQLQCT